MAQVHSQLAQVGSRSPRTTAALPLPSPFPMSGERPPVVQKDCWRGSVPDPLEMSLRNPSRSSDIHRACMAGDVAAVDVLLLNGEDIYKREAQRGYTPLHDAAGSGHLPVVELLLECRASANFVDFRGFTPLHEAAFMGHAAVVAALLSGGADADFRAQNETTPVQWARLNGHQEVLELLGDRLEKPDLVVTLHASREEPSGRRIIACVLMGGREVDVARVDPEQATFAELLTALALELRVPRHRVRVALASGRLLTSAEEADLLGRLLAGARSGAEDAEP
uniref:Uncharacterized protein n=1 Tax=Alexandrium monilatum TaxID=311494 RepID=A0A7S4VLM8_9DINO